MKAFRKVLTFGLLTVLLTLVLLVPTTKAANGNDAQATVPLKTKDLGTWGIGTQDCGSLFPVVVETTGTGTHLGAYSYSARECADFATMSYAGEFTITAADGATLFGTYSGSFDFDETEISFIARSIPSTEARDGSSTLQDSLRFPGLRIQFPLWTSRCFLD